MNQELDCGSAPHCIVCSTSKNPARISTPYLFRVGGRRKTSPALSITITTTTPKPSSRPTKIGIGRRKSPTTFRPLESQEATTKARVVDNKYRFVSRRPFFRSKSSTTQKPTTEAIDQDKESSNQQSLEESFKDNDTTELGDIAIALQELQQAPFPKTTPARRIPTVPTSPRPTAAVRSRKRFSTTSSPLPSTTKKIVFRKAKPQAFDKINPSITNSFRSLRDYDYYDDEQMSVLGSIPEHSKVLLHSNGVIECLDQGNFPHPVSCKKFISCAKMENGKVLGWEYTCPKNLSFDPIGGICNWSAGLGCHET